jgi:hypothetical protein
MSGMFGASFGAHPVVTLLVAFAISVVFHEMGHLVPSLWFRFHVARIALGPICATRTHGSWKLRYSRHWFAASVAAVPCDETAWRFRMLTVVAGGPVATLVMCLVAAGLLNNLAPGATGYGMCSALAQLNFFLFVFSLVPNSRNASVRNDARLFLVLIENGCETEQIRLYHMVTQLQIAGVRPRAYPRELITRVAAALGNRDLMLFSAHTVFLWALDSDDIAVADAWDQRANALLEDHTLRLTSAVLCESACFDILHRNRPETGAEKLRAINPKALAPWLQHRAKAAELIAHGANPAALSALRNARASFLPGRPYFEFESKILERLESSALRTNVGTMAARAAA